MSKVQPLKPAEVFLHQNKCLLIFVLQFIGAFKKTVQSSFLYNGSLFGRAFEGEVLLEAHVASSPTLLNANIVCVVSCPLVYICDGKHAIADDVVAMLALHYMICDSMPLRKWHGFLNRFSQQPHVYDAISNKDFQAALLPLSTSYGLLRKQTKTARTHVHSTELNI